MNIDPSTLSKEQLIEFYLKSKEENHHLKCNISGWDINGDGISNLSDSDLSNNIRHKIPDFTFESVSVTTLQHTFFGTTRKTARLIELKRTQGFFVEFFRSFGSILWYGSSSAYVKELDNTTIMKYLVDSSQIAPNHEQLAKKDLQNAYYQCKTIKIWIPNDLKNEAEVVLNYESKMVCFAIEPTKAIRLFFKK